MSALAPAETSARLLIAVLFGALIGINRDLHGKPAGLRTHSLVALGAALAVLASARLAGSGDHQADVVSRVAQGVLTGVGFLGAGVILRDPGDDRSGRLGDRALRRGERRRRLPRGRRGLRPGAARALVRGSHRTPRSSSLPRADRGGVRVARAGHVPKLHECAVADLCPTQITVGMIEVRDKRKHLEQLGHHARRKYLEAHPIPAVFGPAGALYITDHHHLARVLWEAGIASGLFLVEADFTALHPRAFWVEMDARHWVHPIDAEGRRHGVDALRST